MDIPGASPRVPSPRVPRLSGSIAQLPGVLGDLRQRGAWEADERQLAEKLAVREDARGLWRAMLEEYTVRRLAVAGDQLPGFSEADEYMTGLWKSQLVDDLMWQSAVQYLDASVRISLDRYRSPRWSWISVLDHDEPTLRAASFITHSQHILLGLGGGDENTASLVRHKAPLAHDGAPFGRVLSGEITLRAQVAAIPENLGAEEERGRWEAVLAACDYQLSGEDASRLRLLRLRTGWQGGAGTSRTQRGDAGFLVLPCEGSGDGSFWRRVGCFWDWIDAGDGVPLLDWDAVGFGQTTLV